MRFLPPFVVFGTHRLQPVEIDAQAVRYRALIEALLAGEPDDAERRRLTTTVTINGFVDRLVSADA